jgi:catechol 2,3-dioxygenase-like lactoylglutathione lyase family enzyme
MDQITIAHVTVEVRRPETWRRFLAVVSGGAARVEWGTESAHGALRLREGKRDDLVALGLGWTDPTAFAAALDRLRARGTALAPADLPGARRAFRAADPAGNALELMLLAPAPEAAGWPVGHVALADAAPGEMVGFYAEAIGFTLHERLATKLGPLALEGGFLGTTARHHALAVLNVPGRRRLNHIMFEAPSVAEVARLLDQTKQAGVPISLGLGQHPLPDGTTSFYAAAPSGFDIEIGAGAAAFVAPQAPAASSVTSLWGHRPSLRAKLRIVGALALGGVRRRVG